MMDLGGSCSEESVRCLNLIVAAMQGLIKDRGEGVTNRLGPQAREKEASKGSSPIHI